MNTQNLKGGICRQVIVKASTAATTFHVTITDENSLPVRTYSTATGILLDDNRVIPVMGIYTLQITTASADGLFTLMMMVEE